MCNYFFKVTDPEEIKQHIREGETRYDMGKHALI
mgnify:CR=1 FL=1